MEQNIPIGIIGPQRFMSKMAEVLKGFPSFLPLYRGYEHENEAPRLAAELQQHAEVLLFTGPIPYRIAKDNVRFIVPAHYIPLTGGGLFRALFDLREQDALQALSLDTLPPEVVRSALREFNLSTVIQAAAENGAQIADELVRFHQEMFARGQTSGALTGRRSVAEELTKAGIPNGWVIPTDQDIIVALERALLSTESRKNKESQIVLGLIRIDDFHTLTGKHASAGDVQKLRLDVQRMLLEYVESLDGHFTHFGGEEYLFVTTRGIFERETGGYKYIPLAAAAQKQFGLRLSIGIGFGLSAGEAGNHARAALRHAMDSGGNVCFIVREDEGLIGPLEMAEPLVCDLSLVDPELVRKASEAGLTERYLARLIAQVTRTGKTDYSAQALAEILEVTVRSTHRFLLAWLDAGLVEAVAEEKSPFKGRPRQIFRLAFLQPLLRKR